jgi:hypothetical protein
MLANIGELHNRQVVKGASVMGEKSTRTVSVLVANRGTQVRVIYETN